MCIIKVINKYMLPATINTSIGLKVVEIICLATPVRSSNVTVLAKEVPFNINIISFPYAGKDCLIAMGSLILRKVLILFIFHEFLRGFHYILSIFQLNFYQIFPTS